MPRRAELPSYDVHELELTAPSHLRVETRPPLQVARRALTAAQCDQLLRYSKSNRRYYRSTAGGARDAEIFYLYPNDLDWVFPLVLDVALANNIWHLEIAGIAHPMRIQRYSSGGFSDPHTDFDYESPDPSKITAIIPLVRRRSWSGGRLLIGNSARSPTALEQGDCVLFPSFSMHSVTPVRRGTRVVLSAWLSGALPR